LAFEFIKYVRKIAIFPFGWDEHIILK